MGKRRRDDWTISTLKEHFEKLFREMARALRLQAKEYKRRLKDLNGEQARIASSQATYVSRELWDRSQSEDREWKRKADLAIAGTLSADEFQRYKETTDRALQLKAGQDKGISTSAFVVVQVITSLAALGALAVSIAALIRP